MSEHNKTREWIDWNEHVMYRDASGRQHYADADTLNQLEQQLTAARAEGDDYKSRNQAEYYRNEELNGLLSETARRAEAAELENFKLVTSIGEIETARLQLQDAYDRVEMRCEQMFNRAEAAEEKLRQATAALGLAPTQAGEN